MLLKNKAMYRSISDLIIIAWVHANPDHDNILGKCYILINVKV